jgi:spermidine/putrescine transport system ATP-binding protein
VTHDQEEALSMSDTICIMREGRIIQSGSPRELYDEPLNRYVADFVGKTNFFSGEVVDTSGSSVSVKSETGQVLVGQQSKGTPVMANRSKASIAVRPEMISISAADEANKNSSIAIRGQVMNRIFLGEHSEYLVATEGFGDVLVLSPKVLESNKRSFAPGDNVSISWEPEAALVLGDA